jgi:dTMP kinase
MVADVGLLVAFEGLDQSGKQTQAERLRDRLTGDGRLVRLLSFPDYTTAIGGEIGRALRGERDYTAEVMQLLYVANRYEWKNEIAHARAAGTVLVCDRYLASSIAYGEAHGLDGGWLRDIQAYLPQPDLTVLLDIEPDVSARRKTADRDKYERDLELLARVRESYRRQAAGANWIRLDADRDRSDVARDVYAAISAMLTAKATRT